jgi:hypothetical protein
MVVVKDTTNTMHDHSKRMLKKKMQHNYENANNTMHTRGHRALDKFGTRTVLLEPSSPLESFEH